MKEYTFSKDSWHYKMCAWGNNDFKYEAQHMDMCEYIRCVISKMFTLACGCVLLAAFAGLLLLSWYDLFAWFFFNKEMFGHSIVMLGIQAGIVGLIGFAYVHMWYKEKHDTENPGLVVLAYRKFKDKTCSRVNFK